MEQREKLIADSVCKACPECPFNRSVKPGALGGSPVTTYIGQIYGPFSIACHMHIDFKDPKWKEGDTYIKTPQCAGATIMRANLGTDKYMPDAMPRLPPDRETVFADMVEFTLHHLGLAHSNEADRALRAVLTPKVLSAIAVVQLNEAKWHKKV